jgi:hypothetical protein
MQFFCIGGREKGAVERSRLFVLKLQFPDRFYPEKK